jgi:heptaprenyl diphosphate synthase
LNSTRWSADRSARTVAIVGLLVAVGAVLGLLESSVMPPLPVPGVRLGIANVATVLALALVGARPALWTGLMRVLVVGLAVGSFGGPATLLAFSGALAAWSVMAGLARFGGRFSVVGWSVAGACAHVVGQLAAACLVTGSPGPLLFAPLSLGLALVCGLAVGYSARLLLSRLPLALHVEAAST